MFLPIVECIYIPSDEGEAVPYLSSLIEQHPEIAGRAERTLAATGSARAVLEALVDDGIFERISEDYARCLGKEARYLEEEARRYEVGEREKAEADDRQRG
ncbi:hypothetical protein [Methylobacterium sp. Leaf89]|uniref:hypothetical protein n=1 Tax=Methylobacterium sp. Leaf89 TaxID=1736245 RepID=UPI00070037E6|nr:hypothetical protein [Methylobacterium sp. Leaf89]KQO66386.1 hypothetical protein ASF18_12935 [Methylobacterium sp. Leaf89]